MALKHQTGSLARSLSGVVDRFQTRSKGTGVDIRVGRAEPSYRLPIDPKLINDNYFCRRQKYLTPNTTLSDIRNFCEAYGIEEPRSKSRASGIPRVFKFLASMDVADVERMLDDRMFSGPAQLGPIAGAIRGKAKEYRRAAIDHS